jgi:hypothetical protein
MKVKQIRRQPGHAMQAQTPATNRQRNSLSSVYGHVWKPARLSPSQLLYCRKSEKHSRRISAYHRQESIRQPRTWKRPIVLGLSTAVHSNRTRKDLEGGAKDSENMERHLPANTMKRVWNSRGKDWWMTQPGPHCKSLNFGWWEVGFNWYQIISRN